MRARGVIVGIILMLAACRQQDPLVATWRIARVSYSPSGLATPESLERGQQWQDRSSGLQNSTFALYEEQKSAFFSTRTPYRQGTWSQSDDQLFLKLSEDAPPYVFEILDFDGSMLVLNLIDQDLTDGDLTVICQKSTQYIHDDTDLLAPDQNAWRIRPEKKENPEQIKARTVAHLDYLIAYFEGINEKKQTFFETGLVTTPFVFYSHGLGLKDDTQQARRWQEYYYDAADASAGYLLLKTAMRTVKKFPRAETFTKEYLLAFQQMRRYFDQ